jgi:hypothetical protein
LIRTGCRQYVTLVDERRSFWKSCIGVDPGQDRQNAVEDSFCGRPGHAAGRRGARRWGSRSSGGGKVVWAEVLVESADSAGWDLPQMRAAD